MILTLNLNPNNYNPAQHYVAVELHNNCMTRSLQKILQNSSLQKILQNTIIQKELCIQLDMICMGSSTMITYIMQMLFTTPDPLRMCVCVEGVGKRLTLS